MRLKHIELQGFKSFPDKTVISFGDGITAIVGPNGSGKSNIADAVRWVMGETSSKTLRGQKMEDVIFDGTSLRKPLGYAEVSIVLDNNDATLNIAYEEVALTRRYYRSGESEYFINRSTVRLRDIQELLRDTGLGKTGYSIIGQGAITEIISAKSTERRFLFEEAAGISKFKFKKEESLRKLQKTDENIFRLNDIVTELSDRLVPLEAQSKKARKYMDLRTEKRGLEITLWVSSIAQLEETLLKKKEQFAIFRQDNEKVLTKLDLNEAETNKDLALIEKITAEIEQFRAKSKLLEDEITAKQTQILVWKNDIEHTFKDIQKLEKRSEENKNNDLLQTKFIPQYTQALLSFDTKILEYENEMLLCNEKTKELLNEKENVDKHSAENKLKTDSIKDGLTFLQVRLGTIEHAIKSQFQNIDGTRKEIEDAKERVATLTYTKNTALEKITEINEKIIENKNIKQGYIAKKEARTAQLNQKTADLSKNQFTLSDKTNRLQILEGMEKHYDGFQNSVKIVMEEVKKGSITGVDGTVSDLIKVEDEHTTAIETALGGALQNIVTANEKSGKNCIYFLKNKNAGRATFLPLNTIKGKTLDVSKISSQQGFIGLASDLVKADAKYLQIICYLLGRTVVADNMDNATNIARQNQYSFRVVTLDGQVVNTGGSLTGGSASRGFGVLSRKSEIEVLKKEIDFFNNKITILQKEHKHLSEEISLLSSDVENTDADLRILDEELIKANADVMHFEEYVKNVMEQEETLNREMTDLATKNEKNEEEKNIIRLQIKQNQENLTKVVYEDENLLQKQNYIIEELAKTSDVFHETQMQKLNLEKDRESTEEKLKAIYVATENGRIEEEKLKEETDNLNNQITSLEKNIAAYSENNLQTQQATKASQENMQNKIAERINIEQKITALRAEEKNLLIVKEQLLRELEKCSLFLENAESEKDTVLSKIWDEYELSFSEAQNECIKIENKEEAQKKVNTIKSAMKALGEVNLTSIDEYICVKERFDHLSGEIEDLLKAKKTLEKIIADLTVQMMSLFKENFKIINEEFEKTFMQLFDGGTATLTLENPDDILESGIEILVAPPGKIIKNISSLSGGEQSLTAIALYFAILKIRPAPFCLLDEIEAALDDINVLRFAEYLHLNKKTQFIVITHRRGTMEAADMLYGVTMKEKGISKILSINVSELEKHI